MRVLATPAGVQIRPDDAFPVNRGALCIKGWTAGELIAHHERLTSPLERDRNGHLEAASWDEAMDRIVEGIEAVQAKHGKQAVGVLGGGALTNEKAYLLGKFARVALATPNIDYNGRFCMSSAAAASIRALGIDRGLPFPVSEISQADVVLLAGGNLAETMPPIMQYFEEQRIRGGRLIVADPRRTPTARAAALHLQPTPGSDVALANGLLHVLVRDGLVDRDFIARRTLGFEEAASTAATYWPERVERITGVPEAVLVEAARVLGTARSAIVLTGRGAEQHAQGVNIALSYINLALALGLPGKPCSGYGCVTGQGNGQGGREHGQKADQLPGYRRIDDPVARRHIADVWNIAEAELPWEGKSAYELLASAGTADGIRALLIFGSNPAVSAPEAQTIASRLRALDLLVVSDFFLSESAALADVVLPAAQWAEEDGTVTNLEGRVIRRRKAMDPPPLVRSDIEVLCELGRRLGRPGQFDFATSEDVFDELRRASAGGPADYSGITYRRIDAEDGVFWPCPAVDHPGTPRMFSAGFPTPTGLAQFHAVRHQSPAEHTDAEYPLHLTTGRLLAHYQTGNQTRRIATLNEAAGVPFAEMHPSTAARYGLADGGRVSIETRRGSASFAVKIAPGMRRDTVFVPFHWGGDASANTLTNPALDPVSRMPEFKVCAARVSPAVEGVVQTRQSSSSPVKFERGVK